jgi:hypothetical protein
MRLVDEPKFCAISVQLISSAFLRIANAVGQPNAADLSALKK